MFWNPYLVDMCLMFWEIGPIRRSFVAGTHSAPLANNPDVRTEGRLVRDKASGACCGRSGVFAVDSGRLGFIEPGSIWICCRLMMFLVRSVADFTSRYNELNFGKSSLLCTLLDLCILVLAMLMWFATLVGSLLGKAPIRPFELLVDGDLLILLKKSVEATGRGASAISKIQGHADEGLVREGKVRELYKVGNDLADQAADVGRRRVDVGARRAYTCACLTFYQVVRDLHRFLLL